jgi:flagellar basal body-associated protein FliL
VTDQFAFDLTATGTLTIKGIYTLTINYVDTVGRTLADSYVERLVEGTSFEPVVSPTIAGYTPNFASVSAPENGMPKRDITVDVVYTANPVPDTEPGNPEPGTAPGATPTEPGNPTPDGATPTTPGETTTTTPAATAAVTTPAATAGTTAAANNALTPAAPVQIADNGEVIDNVTIEEEDVPQGMLAFDEDGNPEIVDIEDEQTALADGAETAAWALINLIAAILTAVICILLLISLLKRKKDEEEEENKEASADDEDEKRKKQRVLVKVLGIVPAVVSVIAFILTENMNNPMRWVDRFTLLMIILLVIEILMACFSSKKEKKKEHNM